MAGCGCGFMPDKAKIGMLKIKLIIKRRFKPTIQTGAIESSLGPDSLLRSQRRIHITVFWESIRYPLDSHLTPESPSAVVETGDLKKEILFRQGLCRTTTFFSVLIAS